MTADPVRGGAEEGLDLDPDLAEAVDRLAGAWGCWSPTMTESGRGLAYISDRDGYPGLWVDAVPAAHPANRLDLSPDPVVAVHWSPDGEWLAGAVAIGGGVRTEVWLVRPDGSSAHRVAGGPGHAALGPWARHGHRLILTLSDEGSSGGNSSFLYDPDTARREVLATGPLVHAVDLSGDDRFVLVSDGPRGVRHCALLDRRTGRVEPLLPYPGAGSTELGLIRPGPPSEPDGLVVYLVTDAGRTRRGLVAVPVDEDGRRGEAGTLVGRDDAELELIDADAAGRTVLLVWNVDGRSEVDFLDVWANRVDHCPDLPGTVVTDAILSRDGTRAVLALEGPTGPRRLHQLTRPSEPGSSRRWSPLGAPALEQPGLVEPTLHRFVSHDGLPLCGWLYRPATSTGRMPTVVYVHGGPESQERPGWNAHHQALVRAGIAVFAPNIRGSSGYGRAFVHADDRYGRLDAIDDVAASALYAVENGVADPGRIAVAGRSYGGYATLMALARHPHLFVAGVDVCGMSDLLTFFRDTEPWIARAATSKYGDPGVDARLLAALSPMRHLEAIRAPLLVVHGRLDANVPLGEAHQLVTALRARGRPVQYLELPDEGHEYRRVGSRQRLLATVVRFLVDRLANRSDSFS